MRLIDDGGTARRARVDVVEVTVWAGGRAVVVRDVAADVAAYRAELVTTRANTAAWTDLDHCWGPSCA